MKSPHPASASRHVVWRSRSRNTLAIVAAVMGNWLEAYDFAVFGFFAVVIGQVFFPAGYPGTSLLWSLGAFAVGAFTRPVGALVLGLLCDRHGRRAGLTMTMQLMAVGTVAIACAPSYARGGMLGPIVVVSGRLLQGFALGGEFGAATAMLGERGGAERRALRASLQLASQGAAALLGSAVAATVFHTMSAASVADWGWRVALFGGALVAPLGLYLRALLPEDKPVHRASGSTLGRSRADLIGVLWGCRVTIGKMILVVMGGTVSTYVLTFYMPTYAIHALGLPPSLSMWVGVAAGATLLVSAPVFGIWSDRIRRRRLPIFAGRALLCCSLLPSFFIITHFPSINVIMPLTVMMLLFYAMGSASEFAMMTEVFPTEIRATAMAVAYSLSTTIFGGTAQLVVTALIHWSGSAMAPAWYVAICIVISLIALLSLPETANEPVNA